MRNVFNLSLNSSFRRPQRQPIEPNLENTLEICPNFPIRTTEGMPFHGEILKQLSNSVFWQYALALCVVNFDLDSGQQLEIVFPPLNFSSVEKEAIAFSSFPDSNSYSNVGETAFSFRMPSSTWMTQIYKGQRPFAVQGKRRNRRFMLNDPPIVTDGYTYGFCYFVQQSDPDMRRGYFQKSLVLLTPLPWPGLWLSLTKAIGRKVMDAYFADRERFNETVKLSPALLATISSTSPVMGQERPALSRGDLSNFINQGNSNTFEVLQRACEDISKWSNAPSPFSPRSQYCCHSKSFPMPLLAGAQLHISIPPTHYFAQSLPLVKNNEHCLSDFPANPAPLYTLFRDCVQELWGIWELLLFCEPIIVVGRTPKSVSEVVWNLVELIKPIPYGADFRPYFTVQDPDFKRFVGRANQPQQSNVLLGVTNPLFSKDESKWPNVIKVSTRSAGNAATVEQEVSQDVSYAALDAFDSSWTFETLQELLKTTTFVESVTRKRHNFFLVDKEFSKSLLDAVARDSSLVAANNMVRRHFAELSERFLQPLNKYFDQIMCENRIYPRSLDGVHTSLAIKPFKHVDFLKFIEEHPPTLCSNLKMGKDMSELYALFLKTPNFAMWLSYRAELAAKEFQRHIIRLLTDDDAGKWAAGKSEVAVIDVLIHYKKILGAYSEHHQLSNGACERVQTIPLSANSTSTVSSFIPSANSSILSSDPLNTSINAASEACQRDSEWMIVPSTEQYHKLKRQSQKLLAHLPKDLQASFQI